MPNILIVITGSVAATKSIDLIQKLLKLNYKIDVILTKSAKLFINKESIEKLLNKKIYENLWNSDEFDKMQHINLTRQSDYIFIYPATADFINKVASGFADNLALATILASNKKIYFMPAMNVKMYNNPVTQRNIKLLTNDGHIFWGPESGMLACGEVGEGRLIEPKQVIKKIHELENMQNDLKGKRILITAGRTIEKIDPVRYISNFSSGKQGYLIARKYSELGAEVIFIHAKMDIEIKCDFHKVISVFSANEMHKAVMENLKKVDIAILSAAVADFVPLEYIPNKLKKTPEQENLQINLTKTPDILKEICLHENKPKIVIGFAAESENLIKNAQKKLKQKKCDYILANDIAKNKIFGEDETKISLISASKVNHWPKMRKDEIAIKIIDSIN